jgi:cytoskeletal protein RodZ
MKAGSVTVGESLSSARKARGLSVDDVAADTCIRASLISAIEADHFDMCGGTVYARGHIRSIARVVGIDPAPLIGEFDADHQVERAVSAVAAGPGPTDRTVFERSERHRPNWTVAISLALVVICGFALVSLFTNHSKGPSTPATTSGAPAHHPVVKAPSHKQTPTPPATTQDAASRATLLVRTTHGQTWLQITSKTGATLFSGTLPEGEHKVFSARHGLSFVIGNAPAVDVVVNGHDIGSPPSSNSVSRGNVEPGAATIHNA